MTITEYMTKVTAATATGEYVGRDMVLGLDCAATPSATAQPGSFTYVGAHVEDYGAELDPKTEDKSYVYEGDSTIKTSTQRTFSIAGQAYISDEFMDFGPLLRREIRQGHGGTAALCLLPQRHRQGRERNWSPSSSKMTATAALPARRMWRWR